jgi:hypothetical protein
MRKSVSGLALDLRKESAFVKIWGKPSFGHCFHAREGNRRWGGVLAQHETFMEQRGQARRVEQGQRRPADGSRRGCGAAAARDAVAFGRMG